MKDGQVCYAVGNAGSFSAGRNAAVLQILDRLGHDPQDVVLRRGLRIPS